MDFKWKKNVASLRYFQLLGISNGVALNRYRGQTHDVWSHLNCLEGRDRILNWPYDCLTLMLIIGHEAT